MGVGMSIDLTKDFGAISVVLIIILAALIIFEIAISYLASIVFHVDFFVTFQLITLGESIAIRQKNESKSE